MTEVGIRALKQNASEVVALAAAGEIVTVTDRGRPVATLAPITGSPLERLVASGRARPPKPGRSLADVSPLPHPTGASLSETLQAMRDDERY